MNMVTLINRSIKIAVPVYISAVFALVIVYLKRPLNTGGVVLVFIVCLAVVFLIGLALKTKKGTTDDVLDTIKRLLEISAIIAGGLWAYFTFYEKDEPSLHLQSSISPRVSVNFVNNKMHMSNFVTIRNNGKSGFDVVEPVCIEVWLIPIDTLTNRTYFDWEAYMRKTQSYISVEDSIYKGHYSPNDSIGISHDFFLNIPKNKKGKCTVLVKAATAFKSSGLFDADTLIRDYAYNVKMRYKIADPGSVVEKAKQPSANTRGPKAPRSRARPLGN